QESSEGTINFYDFLGDSWGILFIIKIIVFIFYYELFI
ncbi:putative membrane protein, partial [Acinetobacter baumannii 24975_5]